MLTHKFGSISEIISQRSGFGEWKKFIENLIESLRPGPPRADGRELHWRKIIGKEKEMENFIEKGKDTYYFKMLDFFQKKYPDVVIPKKYDYKGAEYLYHSEKFSISRSKYRCTCGCGLYDYYFEIRYKIDRDWSFTDYLFKEVDSTGPYYDPYARKIKRTVNPKIEEILKIEITIDIKEKT